MGAKIRLENQSSRDLLVQIELTGLTKLASPASQVVIDTDFDKGEEVHVELKDGHVVVWGGVAAMFVEEGKK